MTTNIGAPNSLVRKLSELPEPPKPTRYITHSHTPWGNAQSATEYSPDLIAYGTASHGGFRVSGELLESLPDCVKQADNYADGNKGWFEEDCAAYLVVLAFPQFFPVEDRWIAINAVKRMYPEAFKWFCENAGKKTVPAEVL